MRQALATPPIAAPTPRLLATPVPAQRRRRVTIVRANIADAVADSISDPIIRAAVKEPVAFWGGVFAGALGLNVDEDPLRGWLQRTAADAQGVGYVDTTAYSSGPSAADFIGGGSRTGPGPGVTGNTALRGAGGTAEVSFRTNGS